MLLSRMVLRVMVWAYVVGLEILKAPHVKGSAKWRFKMATVVSAFYPLGKSKHGVANYHTWLRNFCAIPCNLVVATDEASAPLIREARGGHPTEIIVRPFDAWQMTSPTMMEMWRRHHALDPERHIHSPELYAVWALKQEVVMEAIRRSAFGSQYFIWCDIGIQRVAAMQDWYMTFPDIRVCEMICAPGQMAFLEVRPIPESLVRCWQQSLPLSSGLPSVSLGGGCIAGDVAAWTDFSSAYVRMVAEFDAAGRFAGKDQLVFVYMLLTRAIAKPYRLIAATGFGNGGDPWMCFPVILGGKAPARLDGRFVQG